MGLLDEARELSRRPGKPCSVCTLLSVSPLADEIQEALDDPGVSNRGLYEVLTARQVEPLPGYQQIGHHRRGTCGGKP